MWILWRLSFPLSKISEHLLEPYQGAFHLPDRRVDNVAPGRYFYFKFRGGTTVSYYWPTGANSPIFLAAQSASDWIVFLSFSQLSPNGKSPTPCPQHRCTHTYPYPTTHIHTSIYMHAHTFNSMIKMHCLKKKKIVLLFPLSNQAKGNKTDKLSKVNRLKKSIR